MDFTQQILTPEGKGWEHDEHYTDDDGVIKTRKEKLTYYKIAREALLGKVGSKLLNNIYFTKKRFSIFLKIHENQKNVQLTWFEKLILRKLVSMRFDVAPASRLINAL